MFLIMEVITYQHDLIMEHRRYKSIGKQINKVMFNINQMTVRWPLIMANRDTQY